MLKGYPEKKELPIGMEVDYQDRIEAGSFNRCHDLFTKEILARSEVERIFDLLINFVHPTMAYDMTLVDWTGLSQRLSKLFREGE